MRATENIYSQCYLFWCFNMTCISVCDSLNFLSSPKLLKQYNDRFLLLFFVNVILHPLCPTSGRKCCEFATLMKRNEASINEDLHWRAHQFSCLELAEFAYPGPSSALNYSRATPLTSGGCVVQKWLCRMWGRKKYISARGVKLQNMIFGYLYGDVHAVIIALLKG